MEKAGLMLWIQKVSRDLSTVVLDLESWPRLQDMNKHLLLLLEQQMIPVAVLEVLYLKGRSVMVRI